MSWKSHNLESRQLFLFKSYPFKKAVFCQCLPWNGKTRFCLFYFSLKAQNLWRGFTEFQTGPWKSRIENWNKNKYREQAVAAIASLPSANQAALYWCSRSEHRPALAQSWDFPLLLYLRQRRERHGSRVPVPLSSPGAVKWTPSSSVSWQCLDESRGTGQCYCSHLPAGLFQAAFQQREAGAINEWLLSLLRHCSLYWIYALKFHPQEPGSTANLKSFVPVILRLKGFRLKQLHTLSLEAVTRHLPPCQMAGQCSTLTAFPKTCWWHPVKCGHWGLLGTEPGGMWAALLLVSLKAATHWHAEFRKGWC